MNENGVEQGLELVTIIHENYIVAIPSFTKLEVTELRYSGKPNRTAMMLWRSSTMSYT